MERKGENFMRLEESGLRVRKKAKKKNSPGTISQSPGGIWENPRTDVRIQGLSRGGGSIKRDLDCMISLQGDFLSHREGRGLRGGLRKLRREEPYCVAGEQRTSPTGKSRKKNKVLAINSYASRLSEKKIQREVDIKEIKRNQLADHKRSCMPVARGVIPCSMRPDLRKGKRS